MAIAFSGAVSANVSILQQINQDFQVTQKRVATGKKVFGAADDAARYRLSETQLGRAKQIGSVNNNISLGLKTLESTDNTLKTIINLAERAQQLVRSAQSEGADNVRAATSTTALTSASVVSAALVNGSRFSITSDGGGTFTYTFGANAATTTFGEVVDALNAANIGVVAEFVQNTSGSTNLRFRSINGRDFTFNNTTDENAITALGAITSPTGGALSVANQFTTGATAPAVGETGFTISYGGTVQTAVNVTNATAVAANSLLVFRDGTGGTRTLSYTAASTVGQVISDINGLNSGIRAELVNTGAGTTALRLRNVNGGNAEIIAGAGAFVGAAGLARFGATANIAQTGTAASLSSNNAQRLTYGQQYDSVIANINQLIANNPSTSGRNLLTGNNLSFVLDEFSGNALTVTGVNYTGVGSTNTSLGLTAAVGGTTFTSDANIQAAATAIGNAITSLRAQQGTFATFASYVQSRFDINKSYAADLTTNGNDLVAADVAEESANLAALQTQQQFAVQAFSIGSQQQQALLRLLG